MTSPANVRMMSHKTPKKRLSMASKTMLGFAVLIALVGAVIFGVRMRGISCRTDRINALTQQISSERSRTQQLEIALNERRNIDMIRDEAKNRLGMYDPGEVEVRVVSLPVEESGIITVYETGE